MDIEKTSEWISFLNELKLEICDFYLDFVERDLRLMDYGVSTDSILGFVDKCNIVLDSRNLTKNYGTFSWKEILERIEEILSNAEESDREAVIILNRLWDLLMSYLAEDKKPLDEEFEGEWGVLMQKLEEQIHKHMEEFGDDDLANSLRDLIERMRKRKVTVTLLGSYYNHERVITLYTSSIIDCAEKNNLDPEAMCWNVLAHEVFHAFHAAWLEKYPPQTGWTNMTEKKTLVVEAMARYAELLWTYTTADGKRILKLLSDDEKWEHKKALEDVFKYECDEIGKKRYGAWPYSGACSFGGRDEFWRDFENSVKNRRWTDLATEIEVRSNQGGFHIDEYNFR